MASRAALAERIPHDTRISICEFADSDSLVALSQVSKAFNTATREFIRLLSTKLDQTWSADSDEARYTELFGRRPPAEVIPTLAAECNALHTAVIGPGPHPGTYQLRHTNWQRFLSAFGVPDSNELVSKRLANLYCAIKKRLSQAPQQLWVLERNWLGAKLVADGELELYNDSTEEQQTVRRRAIEEERIRILISLNENLLDIETLYRDFQSREAVTRRFQITMRAGGSNLTPFMIAFRISAQKHGFLSAFQNFCRDPMRLSVQKIITLQLNIHIPVEDRVEENFMGFCRGLAARGVSLDITRSSGELRARLENADVISEIARIKHFSFENISGVLPEELNKLTGVEELLINATGPARGNIVSMDLQEFAFPQLRTLTIRDAGLRSVPDFGLSAPQLSRLVIDYSFFHNVKRGVIRVLPDDLARRTQASSFYAYYQNAWSYSLWSSNYRSHNSEAYMNLSSWDLSDIPFFIWFRDNCNVPQIPILQLGRSLQEASYPFIGNVGYVVEDLLAGRFAALMNNPLAIPLALFLTVPAALLGAALAALNVAIFGVNLFLNYAIEPVVTYFRDQLGYSRMVHIRDFPEQGAAL
ncbi:MAG: hypothetical protein HYX48_06005 [Chlamydiales bacterium]|nr:hypothetical protein [Chlamydiales bacterium]